MENVVPNALGPGTPGGAVGIPVSDLGKISVFSKTEADSLAQVPEAALRQVGEGITQAYLSRLNRYALERGLISTEEYQKMEVRLRGQGGVPDHF